MSETLIPRRYQEDVFAQAQQRNIIAALDTGSGKTFISTLLIKWISVQPSSYRKAVVFLVPKVTLAEQQSDFIERTTSFRVLKLYGAMEIDVMDRTGWARKFAQHDVVVCTPQVFLNLIAHSVWHIERVSLLVFDEAHHTRKNHPYNMIMREYKNVPRSKRPKIFGMTASPILSPNQAEKSLKELEANMDAAIIGVAESKELQENSPKPEEIARVFPPPPFNSTCPVSALWDSLQAFDILKSIDDWDVITRRYNITHSNLGPFCAAMYLHSEMWTRVRALIIQSTGAAEQMATTTSPHIADDYYHIAEILLEYQPFFSGDMHVLQEWCTPKVSVLVDLILQYHSPTFQGIIFVEQRQVAACLAQVLPTLPQLQGLVRCTDLVGKWTSNQDVSNSRGNGTNKESMKAFRDKKVNLLIATAVAEEGLDFPACDLVIRFDKVQHLVGYVQSRGRARNKASTFIVMIPQHDTEYLKKFSTLSSSEPSLKTLYQLRTENLANSLEGEDEEQDEHVDPEDMQVRQRYIVPQTGAFVTYDNAITLIGHLCALIPVDRYTSPQIPKYSDGYQSSLILPATLPLAPEDLTFEGPLRHSKKEAKRAVAFMAVVRLHQLDVLDNYLLPGSNKKGRWNEDLEGRPLLRVSDVPSIMDVVVRDPWTTDTSLWMHVVYIDGMASTALITGTSLPPVSVRSYDVIAEVRSSSRVELSDEECWIMQRYTRLALWHVNTTKDITAPLSLYLIPITDGHRPDFDAMQRLLANPYGSDDWTSVTEEHVGQCLVVNRNQHGRPYILHGLRKNLTPMSPLPAEMNSKFATYYDHWVDRWTRKTWKAIVPTDGPLIEVCRLARFSSGQYPLDTSLSTASPTFLPMLFPQGCCGWLALPWVAFRTLPHLTRRLTDVYRARAARLELGLPSVMDDLLVQALAAPGTGASFSNQRLETLGDAVLELCTSVHLMESYPHRHEGQLEGMRAACISNRCLMTRALEVGLQHFVSSESVSLKAWRYMEDEQPGNRGRYARRQMARRCLEDCMEATLGAAYATGGIDMALRAGTALGMSLGGFEPWSVRYKPMPRRPVAPMFWRLEEVLGYKFRNGQLLKQALTHPSFAATENTQSYQRLEFFGDALLDLVVVEYLYKKYPAASSDQLHMPKAKVICAAALAYLAVTRLHIHTLALVNSVDLSMAIDASVSTLQSLTPADIIDQGWKYHPPKLLSDMFESVMGAVMIDSGYDYERTAEVVGYVMRDLLEVTSPSVRRDPVTQLYQWIGKAGCRLKPVFSSHMNGVLTGTAVSLHDIRLAGPIVSASVATSKFAVAERALTFLKEPDRLTGLCDCARTTKKVELPANALDEDIPV